MTEMKSMRKMATLILWAAVAAAIWFCASSQVRAAAQPPPAVAGADLIERAKSVNGQVITFQGEVIGDIMPRQDHFWINVLDNGTAIGVWITAEQRSLIACAGQYGIRGDQVIIVGRFYQACSIHGGDLDIHAQSLVVLRKGSAVREPMDLTRFLIAMILLVPAIICLIIFLQNERRHAVVASR